METLLFIIENSRVYSDCLCSNPLDASASTHCPVKIFVAVTIKSSTDVSERMIAIFDTGRDSCVNRIVKLAVIPPGTGGAAAERIIQIAVAVINQASDTSVPSLSATLIAANQILPVYTESGQTALQNPQAVY